ncbi:T9SS type A sorting domain-containing protein [Flavobacterium sp. HNIBRBA15423]|uniref:T9SS type A sorting domain-containing protein n=1 Tax=Flavobacterium sp. HNIBRBA15423 TaxID=3458683 RepID=UPI004044BFB2
MKKKLLYLLTFSSSLIFSQVTIYEDSFETYPDFVISGITDGTNTWEVLDLDLLNTYTGGADPVTWANAGAPMAFQIFNPSTAGVANAVDGVNGATENANFDPRTGLKYAAAWAGVPSSNGQIATANEDWLISPVINLSGAGGSALSVWVKSLSDTYGLERYRIGVYVGTGVPTQSADFTIISGGSFLTAPYLNWSEYTTSLSAYDGQSIRIGIKCETSDAYMLMVDDFKITAATLKSDSFLASKFNIYPNPVNDIISINSDNVAFENISLTDINGRVIKETTTNSVMNYDFNISDLNSGIYFLKIKTSEGILDKKIIKN